MKYELAKQLKDAGFPQLKPEMTGEKYEWHGSSDDGEYVRYPTLSELIEACGESFLRLIRYEAHDGTTAWRANAYNNENDFIGSTPEEAVANLYLKLKE